MDIARKTFIIIILLVSSLGLCAQLTIVECLNMKDTLVKAYQEGEFMANDTLVDLKNGYYSESSEDKLVRHATIFNNSDGTKILAISVCIWDFVCFNYESNFYLISNEDNSLIVVENENILPHINISDFVVGTSIEEILKKYLPELRGVYLDSKATMDDLLSELYDIKYILPRKGVSIKATLSVCDYIPLNEISIDDQDWKVLERDFLTLKLPYDKRSGKFRLK